MSLQWVEFCRSPAQRLVQSWLPWEEPQRLWVLEFCHLQCASHANLEQRPSVIKQGFQTSKYVLPKEPPPRMVLCLEDWNRHQKSWVLCPALLLVTWCATFSPSENGARNNMYFTAVALKRK